MAEEIINKVAKANIKQIDLSSFLPQQTVLAFDIKGGLWQEMAVKEKEFRDFVKNTDWNQYQDQTVALFCSIDAIVPAWAYMLVTSHLKQVNARIYFGSLTEVKEELFFENLYQLNTANFIDERVMVKGCSDIPNPNKAYVILSDLLVPTVKSLMFGEPCSAVPVYKRK